MLLKLNTEKHLLHVKHKVTKESGKVKKFVLFYFVI